jgi:hypothetical protein
MCSWHTNAIVVLVLVLVLVLSETVLVIESRQQ